VSEALAIETVELRKRFDSTEALRGLNLRVPAGSIFGFLGRNGAGKTTTIKLLLGMGRPTQGQARVFGLAADDPSASVEIRRRTGFVDENKTLYDYMTVDEIIRFTAAFYPGWRPDLEKRYRSSSPSAAAPSCSCSTSRPRGWTRQAPKKCCTPSSPTWPART
jgi:ABC-2 type transport system ATP-binding protein